MVQLFSDMLGDRDPLPLSASCAARLSCCLAPMKEGVGNAEHRDVVTRAGLTKQSEEHSIALPQRGRSSSFAADVLDRSVPAL